LSRSYAAQAYYYQVHARPDSMVRSLSQALGLLNGSSTEGFEAEILTALGNASYRSQRYDDAKLSYTDAQRLTKKQNDIVADQLLSVMLVACDGKRAGARPVPAALADLARRCRSIATSCRQVGFVAGEAFASLLGGNFSYQLDSLAAAREQFQRAIELHEQTVLARQAGVSAFSVLQTFLETEHTGWYDPLIRLHCEAGDKEAAFELLERKNLEDLSAFFGRIAFATGKPLIDNTARVIAASRSALSLLESDILGELRSGRLRNIERIDLLKRLYPQRLAEFEDLGDSLGRSPYQWLLAPGRLRYEVCQESLAAQQALLEYAPVNNAMFAIVVRRDTCYLKKLPTASGPVIALVREYTRLIGDPRLSSGPAGDRGAGLARLNELSSILYSMLVDPVLPFLSGATRCSIVTPPEFGWLPFHTLRGGRGGSLESQWEISYLPTAAALLFPSGREQVVGDVVGLGHPGTTPWDVEYELKDIRSFYDRAKMLFDTMATLRHLAQVQYDLLHIAGEFTLDPDVPSRSALKLSDGTLASGPTDVPLGTLMSLKPPSTLVFSNVSATAGGLDRYAPIAFMASGVRNFIGTLWQGDRKAKKYFGEVFYSNVMTGVPVATAYHMAVLALSKNPEFDKVHRWGSYYRFGR
jgi:tetratricopeptide (TPR) repeat protein